MTTYIGEQRPGRDLLDAALTLSQWQQQYQQKLLQQQELQSRLQTDALQRQQIDLENQSRMQQNQFWNDTKDIRYKTYQTELARSQAGTETEKLRQEGLKTTNELSSKELGRFDLKAAQEDEIFKTSLKGHQQQLELTGVNLDIAKKRAAVEGPKIAMEMEKMKADLLQMNEQTKGLQQGREHAERAQEIQSMNAAAAMMARTPVAEQPALKENIKHIAPELAKYIELLPVGTYDATKAKEVMENRVASMALSGNADAYKTMAMFGAKDLPPEITQVGGFPMKDEKTGETRIVGGTVHTDYSKGEQRLADLFQRMFGAKQPSGGPAGGENQAKPDGMTTSSSGAPINAAELPDPLKAVWAANIRQPDVAKQPFSATAQTKAQAEYLQSLPRDIEQLPGELKSEPNRFVSNDSYSPLTFGDSRVFRLGKQGKTKGTRDLTSFSSASNAPIIKDPKTQDIFEQNIRDDSNATAEQHTMYISLLRELAKAQESGGSDEAGKLLLRSYRALGGVKFFTPVQAGSFYNIARALKWPDNE